jgi:hypothetical protein
MFEREDVIKYADLLELNPDVDVWFFGHWHENQGVTEIAPGKWVVNVGSMTRGSLSQDNLERIPECAVLRFSPEGIEIIQKPLKVEPPEKVFDLERRAAVESREKVMSTFVDRLEQTLSKKGETDFEEVIKGVENIPVVVSDRALEFIVQAKSRLGIT